MQIKDLSTVNDLSTGDMFPLDTSEGKTRKISYDDMCKNFAQNVILRFTQAEWAEADKSAILDGTPIIITDDYDSNVLKTVQECVASTNVNDIAGASVVKELASVIRGGKTRVTNASSTGHHTVTISITNKVDGKIPLCVIVSANNGNELWAMPNLHVGYITENNFTVYYKTNDSRDTTIDIAWICYY